MFLRKQGVCVRATSPGAPDCFGSFCGHYLSDCSEVCTAFPAVQSCLQQGTGTLSWGAGDPNLISIQWE